MNNFCLYPPPILRYFWKDSLMTLHHPTSIIFQCYLNFLIINLSFKTQPSLILLTHWLVAPLNFSNESSPDHYFFDVSTSQSDGYLQLTFYGCFETFKYSNKKTKNQELECRASVKTPLIQSTTMRSLIAQIS